MCGIGSMLYANILSWFIDYVFTDKKKIPNKGNTLKLAIEILVNRHIISQLYWQGYQELSLSKRPVGMYQLDYPTTI